MSNRESIPNYTLGDVFKIIRTDVFELSLLDISNVLETSQSTYYRFENNNFGKNFTNNIFGKLKIWSEKIVTTLNNDIKLITNSNMVYFNPQNQKNYYQKKLFDTLINMLNNSNIDINLSKFNTINVDNSNQMIDFLYKVLLIFAGKYNDVFYNELPPIMTKYYEKEVAPYIRKVELIKLNSLDPSSTISRFDVRFTNPNQKALPTDAMHTIEHFFSSEIRKNTSELIDVSIMGCRTGYFFLFKGNKSADIVADLVYNALNTLVNSTEIPLSTPDLCWNYTDHDIETAKVWAKRILDIPKSNIIPYSD